MASLGLQSAFWRFEFDDKALLAGMMGKIVKMP
jgi:hypothetical protein